MTILDQKTIAQIQEEFSNKFPGLKLEFYKVQHEEGQGSSAKDQHDSSLKISKIRTIHNEGEMIITPQMSVTELEKSFEEKYGLHAQVFRRSNTIWLQTSATDDWTLEVQNRKGLHSIQE